MEEELQTTDESIGQEPSQEEISSVVSDESADNSVGTEPDFDPTQWGYNYKGQTIYPKDRNHMKTLMQQAHVHNSKSEDLNRRLQEIDEMKGKFGKYEQLDKAFTDNPAFAQQIWAMQEKAQNGTLQESNADVPPELQQFHQQLSELQQKDQTRESEHQEWKNQQADIALEKEIQTLRDKFADHEWDLDEGDGSLQSRILQHAFDEGLSLERAYKDLMWDTHTTNVKARTLKQAQEKRVADKKAGVVMGSGNRKPQSGNLDIRGSNYNDLRDQALKEYANK